MAAEEAVAMEAAMAQAVEAVAVEAAMAEATEGCRSRKRQREFGQFRPQIVQV